MKENVKEKLLSRLKTVKGHIGGIERMIEEEKECAEILVQISAIKSSINKIGHMVLEDYAKECLGETLKDEALADELEEMLKFIMKHAK